VAPHFATPSDFRSATTAIISASVLSGRWEPPTTIETFFANADLIARSMSTIPGCEQPVITTRPSRVSTTSAFSGIW